MRRGVLSSRGRSLERGPCLLRRKFVIIKQDLEIYFFLRLRVAMRCVETRISAYTDEKQCNATQRAAVMEIHQLSCSA